MKDIKQLISLSKLSKLQFAKRYKIPYKTLCNWALDPDKKEYRKCPEYVLYLLEKAVKQDFCSQIL